MAVFDYLTRSIHDILYPNKQETPAGLGIMDQPTSPTSAPAVQAVDSNPQTTIDYSKEKASLKTLPLHLVAQTLCQLDAVDQLPSVLLSNRLFHDASLDVPTLSGDLLRAQIGCDESLVLALVCNASQPKQRAQRRRIATVFDFLCAWRDDPAGIAARYRYIKVAEALRVADQHSKIIDLRNEFVQKTSRKLYTVSNGGVLPQKATELSATEAMRIDRAIYRFQIYCNLFAEQFRTGRDDVALKRMFFDRNSLAVNEQLGCFYDFLEDKIDEAIDQVLEHDPEQSWLDDINRQRRKQNWLTLGLPWLHRLINASIDGKTTILLAARDLPQDTPILTPSSPFFATPPTPLPFLNETQLARWNLDVDRLSQEPADDDARLTWEETHRVGNNDRVFIVDHGVALRKLGYVMWDRSRLEECRETVKEAEKDATPMFANPGRFMAVARAWDRQYHQSLKPVAQPGLSARERRAARQRRSSVVPV